MNGTNAFAGSSGQGCYRDLWRPELPLGGGPLQVSVSSAIRWRRLALEHGQAVAKPRGGDRHSGKIEAHGGFIRELLAEQGDMTLGLTIIVLLAAFGVAELVQASHLAYESLR